MIAFVNSVIDLLRITIDQSLCRLFANQDTGVVMGQLGKEKSFRSITQGDGGVAMIDYKSNPESIFLYSSSQIGANFEMWTVNKTSEQATPKPIPLPFEPAFVPVTAMNSNDQSNFAIGAAKGGSVMFYKYDTPITTQDVFGGTVPEEGGKITAMTYSSDGKLYSAAVIQFSQFSQFSQCSINSETGFPNLPCNVMSGPQGEILHMAVDPINSQRVVAVANRFSPRVFESTNGGMNWNDITVGGSSIDQAYNGQACAFLIQGQVSFLVVGTSNGIYLRTGQDWTLLADGMPTAAVYDMTYSSDDDRLVVSTLGRGIWYLPDAFGAANEASGSVTPFTPIVVTDPTVNITINAAITSLIPPDAVPPVDAPAI